jgi:hypothetical protein
MADKYPDPIGNGGIWIKEGKNGKYLSWQIEFAQSGASSIVVMGVAFKNDKKGNEKAPDYRMLVNRWDYPKARDVKPPAEKKEPPREDDDIPF